MNTYAVAYFDFFNNALEHKMVKANTWQEACTKAFDIDADFLKNYKDQEAMNSDAIDQEFQVHALKVS